MEALKEIQNRFYSDFPAHAEEARYGFATPSTIKPTQWSCVYRYLTVCRIAASGSASHPCFHYSIAVQIQEEVSTRSQQSVPYLEIAGVHHLILGSVGNMVIMSLKKWLFRRL